LRNFGRASRRDAHFGGFSRLVCQLCQQILGTNNLAGFETGAANVRATPRSRKSFLCCRFRGEFSRCR